MKIKPADGHPRDGVSWMTIRRFNEHETAFRRSPSFFNNPRLFFNNLPLSLNKRALLGGMQKWE